MSVKTMNSNYSGHVMLSDTHQHIANRSHTCLNKRMIEFISDVASDTVGQDGDQYEREDGGACYSTNYRSKDYRAVYVCVCACIRVAIVIKQK